jgi:hypothetical protein
LGFALRSLLRSKGTRRVSAGVDPRAVPPVGAPVAEARAGPTGRGFWAFTLPSMPGDRTGVNSPTAGCSLGLRPPKVSRRVPGPGFRPDSSHALLRTSPARPTRRRPGVSISSRLAPPGTSGYPEPARDNPFRVPAPARSRTFKRQPARAMGSPHAASHIAADRPTFFGQSSSLYRSCPGFALRCRLQFRLRVLTTWLWSATAFDGALARATGLAS